jgi:hypothetical protein
MLVASLGYLINVGADFSIIADNAFSQLTAFTGKYLTNTYFSEPYFIDGAYGRFSDYGELDYPDNYEEFKEDHKLELLSWDKERIKIRLLNNNNRPGFPRIGFDDIRDNIFINVAIEDEFKSQLESLKELLNPNSKF